MPARVCDSHKLTFIIDDICATHLLFKIIKVGNFWWKVMLVSATMTGKQLNSPMLSLTRARWPAEYIINYPKQSERLQVSENTNFRQVNAINTTVWTSVFRVMLHKT